MKMCTGTGLHPGEHIKYYGEWCPMCALSLALEHRDKKISILEKCLKYHEAIKPSRRPYEPIQTRGT